MTVKQLKRQQEAAEERMKAANKEKAEERGRQELQLHLRREAMAAKKKAKARTGAQRVWVSEGGSPEAFAKAWDGGLYEDIIKARTVARVSAGKDATAEAAGHVRKTFG